MAIVGPVQGRLQQLWNQPSSAKYMPTKYILGRQNHLKAVCLRFSDVRSLLTFLAYRDLELNFLILFQCLEPVHRD